MTITLKSDASGNSGSIQVAGVDRLTLNTDGSLVAGVNPATGTRSMALATMQKFADEFGASLATNGYQKLPSGLIIQWGSFSYTNGSNTSSSVTFPIAFPTACLQVIAGQLGSSALQGSPSVVSKTKTGVVILHNTDNLSQVWIAIGY